jgi:hypothetical protein
MPPPHRLTGRASRGGALVLVLLAAALAGPVAPGRAAMPMLPTITGVARAGQTLTANPQGASIAYQWLRCDPTGMTCAPIGGATGPTYAVSAADYGATIEVSETTGGVTVTSLPTAVVPAPPSILNAPGIAGSPVEGQTLTETRGTWTGAPTTYAQQWVDCDTSGQACAPIAGATAQTYVVTAADIGHTIRVFEVALNGEGTSAPAASGATFVVTGFRPKSTAAPTISGHGQIGATLTCAPGTWTGTQPIAFAYQWLGDGNPLAGATGPTHKLLPSDVALAEACRVTATNAAGTATEQSDSILVTAASACGGLAGGALQRCRAKQAYDLARTRCGSISTRTKAGRARRAACTAKAKLTYKRAIAVAKCQSIKSSKKRAACVARARRIKK